MKRKIFLILFLFSVFVPKYSCAETRARFLFVGDIMAHKQQLDAARHKDSFDFSPQFRRIRPLIENDFLAGNLETVFAGTVSETGKKLKYSGYPMFNTPDSLADVLKDLGFDLLTLANNHIFDKGSAGAKRTAEVLDSADLTWTGLGFGEIPSNDAVILENGGIKAAFINHSYGSNLFPKSNDVHLNLINEKDLTASLERAKSLSPDVIIACFHWGNEYHLKPNIHQKKAADIAFNNGADLIIGTHPHVLQPVEVKNLSGDFKAVAWSLGNFVSFQRTLPRERTCILAVEFAKNENENKTRLTKISVAPLWVIAPGQKRTEITYAGSDENTIEALDFDGLSKNQLTKLRVIGQNVLDFLGAQNEADEFGFYTLWREESPDVFPEQRRKKLN